MSNPVLQEFDGTMTALDKLIYDLETKLGKKHSSSPFEDIKGKFGGKKAKESDNQPAQIEEKPAPKQEAPAAPKGDKKAKKEKKGKQPAPAPAASTLPPELEWFDNCDLRVAKIVECKICDGSDKLYVEKVDLGEGKLRDIGSGVRQFCTLDEMLDGQFCVVFANLKPRPLKVAGIDSHGMVLFAANADRTAMEPVRPPAGSKLGERLALSKDDLIPHFTQDPMPELKPKKKYMEQMLTLLKSNGKCEASYNGIPLKTSGGVVKVASLKDCPIS